MSPDTPPDVQHQPSSSTASSSGSHTARTVVELLNTRRELNLQVLRGANDHRTSHAQIRTERIQQPINIHFESFQAKEVFYDLMASTPHLEERIEVKETPHLDAGFPFFVHCTDIPSDVPPLLFATRVRSIIGKAVPAGMCKTLTLEYTNSNKVEVIFPDVIVTAHQASKLVMLLITRLPAEDHPSIQTKYRWHDLLGPRRYASLELNVPGTACFEICSLCKNKQAPRKNCTGCSMTGFVLSKNGRTLLSFCPADGFEQRFDADHSPTGADLILSSIGLAADEAAPVLTELDLPEGLPFTPGASDGRTLPEGRLYRRHGSQRGFTPLPEAHLATLTKIMRRHCPQWNTGATFVTANSVKQMKKVYKVSPRGENDNWWSACQMRHEMHYSCFLVAVDGGYTQCPVCNVTSGKTPLMTHEQDLLFPNRSNSATAGFEAGGGGVMTTLEDRVSRAAMDRIQGNGKRLRSIHGYPKPT